MVATVDTRVTIELGDIDVLRMSVATVPFLSVTAVLADTIAGCRPGVPERVRRDVRAAVPTEGRRALAPMAHPGWSMVPSCLIPVVPAADLDLREALAAMRDLGADEVRESVYEAFGSDVPRHWASAADSPGRWIHGCAEAASAVISAAEGYFAQGRPLVARERERVGVGVVTGCTREVLGTLSPRVRVVGDSLVFDDVQPGHYELGGRRLVFVPMVCSPTLLITCVDEADVVWLGYPVPGVGRLGSVPEPVETDRLATLLGPQRAAVLRFLSRPSTMSEAAEGVGCPASTLTFHCRHLELLGLVTRDRRGRSVRLARTERAEQLLDLMA